jgi:hypothetical protein
MNRQRPARSNGQPELQADRRIYGGSGQPELPESGNEFQEATGDRSFHGAPGDRGSGKSPGNWRFQSTAGRLA